QAAVGAIWRGDVAAISSISARYSPQMQLVGKLYRDDDGWTADWIMVDNGRELSSWSSHDRSALRAMAGGADGAADALSARYAKAEPIGEPGRHEVMFSGIDSSEDYMRLVAWLRAQSVVRDVRPLRAAGDRLEVELDLATGLAGLRRVLDGELLVEEPVLVQAPAGEGAGGTVAFRLRWGLVALASCWLLWLLSPILAPFVLAALLGWLGDPLVDRIQSRGVPRNGAVIVVFSAMAAVTLLGLLLLLPLLQRQLVTLF